MELQSALGLSRAPNPVRAHPSQSVRRIAASAASAIEHAPSRMKISLIKQVQRRSGLKVPFPRKRGEGLLKRSAASRRPDLGFGFLKSF
jgi:hypothetical protein